MKGGGGGGGDKHYDCQSVEQWGLTEEGGGVW